MYDSQYLILVFVADVVPAEQVTIDGIGGVDCFMGRFDAIVDSLVGLSPFVSVWTRASYTDCPHRPGWVLSMRPVLEVMRYWKGINYLP